MHRRPPAGQETFDSDDTASPERRPGMFEKFRQDARHAVVRAREEAAVAGQGEIGCEHLLLGLLAEPGPAAAAMTAAGLELTALRSRLPQADRAEPDALDADALASVGIDLDQVR